MTRKSLNSTTAMVVAVALLQPLPALAQTRAAPSDATISNQGISRAAPELVQSETELLEEVCDAAGPLGDVLCEREMLEDDSAGAGEGAPDPEPERPDEAREDPEGDDGADARATTETEAEMDSDPLADALEDELDAREAEAESEAQSDAGVEVEAEGEADARSDPGADPLLNALVDALSGAVSPGAQQDPSGVADGECIDEVVIPERGPVCIDDMTGAEVAELMSGKEAEVQALAEAEVSTETVTEETARSSAEEFVEHERDEGAGQSGRMSDLERAGLGLLGALTVGAILSDGQRVTANTGDRVVVQDDGGEYRVLKDDDTLIRRPGADVRTERYSDGSTRTSVMRADGTEIETIRDPSGRVLRRSRIHPDGQEVLLIDDTRSVAAVDVRALPSPSPDEFTYQDTTDQEALRTALIAAERQDIDRYFSLRQVREIAEVRELAPEINLEDITFRTDSAAIQPSQAEDLRQMGRLMRSFVADNPREVFLIEGHTDAIGDPGYNLLLSDRRAESVALALTEYFDVPPENMVIQGYGERFLKIPTREAERLNRRVSLRRITPLLQP